MSSKIVIGGKRGGFLFASASIATAGLSLPTQILLERSLGIQGFAQWSFLNSLCTILVTVACLGANSLILSEFFHGRLKTSQGLMQMLIYLGSCSILGLFGFFGAYLWTLQGSAPLLPSMPLELVVFFLQIPILLIYPVFQIREQAVQIALWPLFQNLSRFAVAVAAIICSLSYLPVVSLWGLTSFALAGWAIYVCWPPIYRRLRGAKERSIRSATRQEGFRDILKSGVGFGANETLDSLDLKLVIPLAALFFGSKEIAAASLAMLFLLAFHFFPYVVSARLLLPAVHRTSETDPRPLIAMIYRLCLYSFALLVPLSVILFFFGYFLITKLTAGDYSSQQATFRALGATVIPVCLSFLAVAPFMSKRHNSRLLRWRTEALLIFLGLSFSLVHVIGVSALLYSIAISRTYLCARFFLALKQLKRDVEPEVSPPSYIVSSL